MVFSAFPLSALAADVADVAADNAWKRMLEIGIVDEDGDLIEDTAFTLADGREAYSITEFLNMIDAEDTDPDMAVTVWGNGSVATVQEIVYALSIEYQMKDITSSVRYLSENGAAANETTPQTQTPHLRQNHSRALRMRWSFTETCLMSISGLRTRTETAS